MNAEEVISFSATFHSCILFTICLLNTSVHNTGFQWILVCDVSKEKAKQKHDATWLNLYTSPPFFFLVAKFHSSLLVDRSHYLSTANRVNHLSACNRSPIFLMITEPEALKEVNVWAYLLLPYSSSFLRWGFTFTLYCRPPSTWNGISSQTLPNSGHWLRPQTYGSSVSTEHDCHMFPYLGPSLSLSLSQSFACFILFVQ